MKVFIELTSKHSESSFFLNPLSIEAIDDLRQGGSKVITPDHEYIVFQSPSQIIKLVEDFIKDSVNINGM